MGVCMLFPCAAMIFIEAMLSLVVTDETCARCSTPENRVLKLQYRLNPREVQVFGDGAGTGCPLCCHEIVSRCRKSTYHLKLGCVPYPICLVL